MFLTHNLVRYEFGYLDEEAEKILPLDVVVWTLNSHTESLLSAIPISLHHMNIGICFLNTNLVRYEFGYLYEEAE